MTDGLRVEVANRSLDIRISTISPGEFKFRRKNCFLFFFHKLFCYFILGPTESNFNTNSFKSQEKIDQTFGTNRAFSRYFMDTVVSLRVTRFSKE